MQKYRCGSDATECDRPSKALLVVEFDGLGNPLRARVLGSPAAVIGISDLAVLADGRLIVAGEYSGPRTELGGVSACELEVGLPDPEAVVFPEREKLTTQRCVCRDDRRDLFVSELDARGEVAWWKTLALGEPKAQLGVATRGQIVWGAGLSHAAKTDGVASSVWLLDSSGAVRSRGTTAAFVRELSVGAGGAYVSDAHTLRRISWGS